MKDKRKIIILLAIMSAAILLFVACGGGSSSEPEAEPEAPAAEEQVENTEDSEGPAEAMHDASEYKDASGSADYDVSKGFEKQAWEDKQILYFNDFMMTMPDNEKWSFDMNGNAVTFYLFSAQQEGNGGRLVTIKGYDIDDKSYEELPMPYHVAGVGKNVNKRFIAIYPSDVQYDINDKTQSADYMELFEYLQKIEEGSSDSPLQTSDSD